MNITRDQLEDLYCGQKLSIRKCAERLGLPTFGGISWRLKKFGIQARPQLQVDKWNGGAKPRDVHKKIIPCAYCGKSLSRFPSLINTNNFCNHVCRGKWLKQDLSGKKFGRLTVIEESKRDKHNHVQWKCLCECGKTKNVKTGDLLEGRVKSCGCTQHPIGKDNHLWRGGKLETKCANPSCRKTLFRYESLKKLYADSFCDAKCRAAVHLKGKKGEMSKRYVERHIVPCDFCGEEMRILPSYKKLYKRHFCNMKCRGKWNSQNLNGENNPTWKGGKSFEPYPITWNEKLRELIRKRDGRKCLVCGIPENGNHHEVHHIDYDKENLDSKNLITLCRKCHSKTNYNRETWKWFFLKGDLREVNL